MIHGQDGDLAPRVECCTSLGRACSGGPTCPTSGRDGQGRSLGKCSLRRSLFLVRCIPATRTGPHVVCYASLGRACSGGPAWDGQGRSLGKCSLRGFPCPRPGQESRVRAQASSGQAASGDANNSSMFYANLFFRTWRSARRSSKFEHGGDGRESGQQMDGQ